MKEFSINLVSFILTFGFLYLSKIIRELIFVGGTGAQVNSEIFGMIVAVLVLVWLFTECRKITIWIFNKFGVFSYK